jgi:hypothetical protein
MVTVIEAWVRSRTRYTYVRMDGATPVRDRGALVDAVLVRAPPLPAGYGDAGSIASNPMSIAVLALADPLSFVAWVGRLQVRART